MKIPTKRPKRSLGELCRESAKQGKFFMGHSDLTHLWNLSPDNLQACRGDDRNFLPSIESYLEKGNKTDPSFEWRALRLLSRQSPHFFTLNGVTPSKISDYLEAVEKKMHETKTKHKPESETDLMVEKDDVLPEDDSEMLKNDQIADDQNIHKTSTATQEQLKELSVVIGSDWKKLAAKLGS